MELLDGVFESNGAMDVRVGNIYVLMSRKGQSGSVRSTPKRVSPGGDRGTPEAKTEKI
jgi:hypothetical protein